MVKKAIVTGGAGFIGSHLAEELASRGYDVTVFDDLSNGKEANIRKLIESNSVKFVRGSVMDTELLKEVFKNTGVVFHLAAIGSVPRSVADPGLSHSVNASGTLNVLIAARDNNVGKLVYSSSSSVYGDTPVLPKVEDMIPAPLSPYAVSKLAAEYYCGVFQKVYGLNTVSLRYFNIYGPRQDPDSQYAAVIPKFIKSCFNGEPPLIYDDGEQTRDFTFVKDAVAANILAAESDAGGVYNISRGEKISVNKLAGLIIELTGSDVKPAYTQARSGDVKHSLADISRAGTFGYKPEYNLESGLAATVDWFKNG